MLCGDKCRQSSKLNVAHKRCFWYGLEGKDNQYRIRNQVSLASVFYRNLELKQEGMANLRKVVRNNEWCPVDDPLHFVSSRKIRGKSISEKRKRKLTNTHTGKLNIRLQTRFVERNRNHGWVFV